MSTGARLVQLAKPRIGERYVNVLVPKNNPNWTGPWDCAEFASWLVYQATGRLYGCTNNSKNPATVESYTGAWKRDAETIGDKISVATAAATEGAFVLRYPPTPGSMGHIALCVGDGTTIEAMGVAYGVTRGKVAKRQWDTGVVVPGISVTAGQTSSVHVPPAMLYGLGMSNMSKAKVQDIQAALKLRGYDPGPIDGVFGKNTTAAVAALQASLGLVMDGQVGSRTADALGIEFD